MAERARRPLLLLLLVRLPRGGVDGREAGDAVEGEEALAGKVVEGEHVVVEHGEANHGVGVPALGGAGGAENLIFI